MQLHGGLSSRAVDELGARFLGDLSEVTLGAMRQVGVNLPHGLCVNLACLALGIPVCTSHSFRHGAAARACLLGVHPEEIRRRGRWGSLAAMDTYLQTVRATLLSTDTPAWWAPFIPKLPRWRADLAQFSRQ